MSVAALIPVIGTPTPARAAVPANYTLWDECVNDSTVTDPDGADNYMSWEDTQFPHSGSYGQDRLLMETQAWWFPNDRANGGVGAEDDPEDRGGTATGQSHGHIHTTVCVPDWRSEWRNQFLGLHIRVLIHTGTCVPVGCSNPGGRPNVIDQVKANDLQFQGIDTGGQNELIDDFNNFPQSQLTCDHATDVNCEWFFDFTKAQDFNNGVPSCTGSGAQVRCDAPKINLTASNRGACTAACGFEYDGNKQFRIYGIQGKGFEAGFQEANMRAIVRFPLDLNLGRIANNANAVELVTEASGWWTNKENNAAGGYVTGQFSDSMGLYRKNPVTPGGTITIDPFTVLAQPCSDDCSVARRELAGWRAYFDPDFHRERDPTWDEKANRISGKDVLFSINGDIDTSPDETNGTISAALSASQRQFTIPSTWAPGLHRIVIVARQPTQKVNGTPSIPSRDESTLFGVFVHYVVVA